MFLSRAKGYTGSGVAQRVESGTVIVVFTVHAFVSCVSKVCLGSESYSLYQQNEMKLILDTNTNGSIFAQEQADTGTRGTANTGDRKRLMRSYEAQVLQES